MAIRGFLERPKSTSDRFLEAFSNAGQAVPEVLGGLEEAYKKSRTATAKKLANAGSYVAKELKHRNPDLFFHEGDKAEVIKNYSDLISRDPNLSEYEALEMATNMVSGKLAQGKEANKSLEGGKKKTTTFTPEDRAKLEYPYGIGSYIAKHPKQAAADLGIVPLRFAEQLAGLNPFEIGLNVAQGKDPISTPATKIAEKLSGISDLPQSAQDERGLYNMILESLPIEKAISVLSGLGPAATKAAKRFLTNKSVPKGPISPSEILAPERAAAGAVQEAKAPISKAATPAGEAEASLANRVSKEVAETPTEARIARTKPETRVYNRLENVKTREQQLKLFPKYEVEIAADESARAARAASREPKTPAGQMSQQARIETAEKQVPVVRSSYENAVGRVRALEDEVSKLTGSSKENAQTLLQLAQRDLEHAEFELMQTMQNARFGERRVGIETMTKAAQDKLLKIREMAEAGESISLSKADYSPSMIAEAKRYQKSKKLPARQTDDYYTKVHDTYADAYKKRLAELDQEMSALSKEKGFAPLHRRQMIHKEQEAIGKMIKSAEAENAIHRHKIALREIAQRQKAKERFSKLQPAEGKEKVSTAANEKMWRGRMKEARTPAERSQVIDDAVEQVAASDPKHAEQIRMEGEKVKEKVEELGQFKAREAKEPPSGSGETHRFRPEQAKEPGSFSEALEASHEPSQAKDAKQAGSWARQKWEKFVREAQELKNSAPYIWNSKMGKDVLAGIAGPIIDEFADSMGIPHAYIGSILTILVGRRGGAFARIASNAATKTGINQYHHHRAARAYEERDREKFESYSPKIQKKVKERARSS